MTVRQGSVVVSTTSPGYKLYISMLSDNTSLSSTNVSSVIAATSGTFSTPSALTRGTWGYAIPSGTSHIASNGFNATYNEMSSSTPNSSAIFAIPPIASSNPQLIASSTSAATGDTYPIYYGIRANSSTNPGVYSNNIAFTAVADAGSVEKVTVTPSSSNVNASVTMSVDTTLYTTEGFAEANVYLLTATEYNSISGTNVEALGKTPLSCNRANLAPLSYSCTFTAPSTQNTYYIYVKAPRYNKVYTTTFNTNNPVTLTVNPNGGTWSGSSSSQTFTQNQGTTKTISNPTAGPSYTITYNANSQGATYTASPTSVQRAFTSWSKSGGGSLSGTTYTFGSTNGTLTANYNSTSNSFTLPTITKSGQNCYWAEGSASGTQYAGGTSRTITGNKTYYAVCAVPAFFTITQMQQMTSSVCNSVVTPSASATTADTTGAYTNLSNKNTSYVAQRTLTDTRDNNTYVVRKLADGNCWMTQNLRLSKTMTLTSTNSDITSSYSITGISGSTAIGDGKAYNTGNTSYGAYYYYSTATAGTNPSSGDASSSICPKAWRLPSSSELALSLNNKNFVGSGYRTGSTNIQQGEIGYYWSATAVSSTNAYSIHTSNAADSGQRYSDGKQNGFAVRCIAR